MASTYGTILRKWREEAGITQDVAAKQIGVTQGCWGSWEVDRTAPTTGNALDIEKLTKGVVPARAAVRPRRVARRMPTTTKRTGTDG